MSVEDAVEELIEKFELGIEICNSQVTDKDLDQIANHCCKELSRLPPYLEIGDTVFSDIKRDEKSEPERRLALFKKWKQKKGSCATYKEIITVFLKIELKDDAEKVCKWAKSTEEKLLPRLKASTGGIGMLGSYCAIKLSE